MVDQLGSLLLPIDALLTQTDFDPCEKASPDTVTLFRNLWFLSVLFRFTDPEERGEPSAEWQVFALTRIAAKTPSIVPEDGPDFVTSNLEYNTVIRQEYAHAVRCILTLNYAKLTCGLYPGHSEAPCLAIEAHSVAPQRDPLLAAESNNLSAINVRLRGDAILRRSPVVSSDVFRE